MADSVRNHPEAGELFRRGHAEKSMYWTEPQSGVRLRGRADWLTLVGDRLTCVDLKTAASVYRPTERAFWKNGYHLQNAWYVRLLTEIKGSEPDFAFVCVEKEPLSSRWCGTSPRMWPRAPPESHRHRHLRPLHRDGRMARLHRRHHIPTAPRWVRNDTARAEADARSPNWKGIVDHRRRHPGAEAPDARSAHRSQMKLIGRALRRSTVSPRPHGPHRHHGPAADLNSSPLHARESFLGALMTASQLGLEPARWVRHTWSRRQRGDVHPRLSRADQAGTSVRPLVDIWAEIVYANDTFRQRRPAPRSGA